MHDSRAYVRACARVCVGACVRVRTCVCVRAHLCLRASESASGGSIVLYATSLTTLSSVWLWRLLQTCRTNAVQKLAA